MHPITVNDLVVNVIRKDIENLPLMVYPPRKRVWIAVLSSLDNDAAWLAVFKLAWIKHQRVRDAWQKRQTERKYVPSERHYFRGNRYGLNAIYTDTDVLPKTVICNTTRLDFVLDVGDDGEQWAQVVAECASPQ